MQSNRGLEFLKRREDCKLEAYLDVAGIPTIGYGSTLLPYNRIRVKMGDRITQKEADILLKVECEGINSKLYKLINVLSIITDCKVDSLISFCYNVGTEAFKNSTLRKFINQNESEEDIRFEFMRWNKAHVDGKLVPVKGLTNRRRLEANLYFSKGNMEAYEK